MPCLIENSRTEPVSLPYPFRGILAPGRSAVLDLTKAQVITALAGSALRGGIRVTELPANHPGPFNSAMEGTAAFGSAVLADPSIPNGAMLLSLGGVVYGDGNMLTDGAGGLFLGGDLSAAGGFRQTVGAWGRLNVAASLTADPIQLLGVADLVPQWVAPRAGSITALTAILSGVPAGSNLTINAFDNTTTFTGCQVVITLAGAVVLAVATFAKDTHVFAAGARLNLRVTTPVGWTGTTLDLTAWMEVEC